MGNDIFQYFKNNNTGVGSMYNINGVICLGCGDQ